MASRAGAPTETERWARVALNVAVEPGHPGLAETVAAFGAERTVELLLGHSSPVLGEPDVATRLRAVDPARVLEQAQESGLRYLVPGDPEWPPRLDDLRVGPVLNDRGGAPLGLWVAGELPDLNRGVAVVGARSATTYGERVAEEIAAEVAAAGWTVVSGGAFGVDRAAHRGALAAGGATIAVLACGADRDYPVAHADLLGHLRTHGAVVAESPPGAAPLRHRFLARNRIIAGLTTGTVVVEAAWRSGALNTANWARQLNRGLMGVPGPVTSVTSTGVHELIRAGAAMLVTSGKDVLELVSPTGEHLAPVRRGTGPELS